MTQVKVYVIDEESSEYRSFSSIVDAATYLDLAPGTVSTAMKDDRLLSGRYRITKVKPRDIEKHKPAAAEREVVNYVSPRTSAYKAKQDEAIAKVLAAPKEKQGELMSQYNAWAAKNYPDVHADFVSMFDL